MISKLWRQIPSISHKYQWLHDWTQSPQFLPGKIPHSWKLPPKRCLDLRNRFSYSPCFVCISFYKHNSINLKYLLPCHFVNWYVQLRWVLLIPMGYHKSLVRVMTLTNKGFKSTQGWGFIGASRAPPPKYKQHIHNSVLSQKTWYIYNLHTIPFPIGTSTAGSTSSEVKPVQLRCWRKPRIKSTASWIYGVRCWHLQM